MPLRAEQDAMLVPLGRFSLVLRAERLDPYGTLRYRYHALHGVTPITLISGEM